MPPQSPTTILRKVRRAVGGKRVRFELQLLISALRALVNLKKGGSPIRTISQSGLKVSFINTYEFKRIYQDVFTSNDYWFKAETNSPLIIDCGAHIGVSVLYFKTLYPSARIIAIEPNPKTFELLERNVADNSLRNVELVNAAVADEDGEIEFYVGAGMERWSWADTAVRNLWKHERDAIRVPAVRLSRYLQGSVDLLKLDVEGLESVVLGEANGKLEHVRNIVLEFHGSRTNPKNQLHDVLALLRRNGFAFRIIQDGKEVAGAEIFETDPYFLMIRATAARR